MLRNLREKAKNKKGFTLIELIIVIVILVILAAIGIPSISAYIDRANKATATANGRSAYLAVVAATSDALAEGKTIAALSNVTLADAVAGVGGTVPTLTAVKAYTGTLPASSTISATIEAGTGKVNSVKYYDGSKYTVEVKDDGTIKVE